MDYKLLTRRIKNFRIGHPDDEQLLVEVYPKTKKHDRSDIDIIRLSLKSLDEKESRYFDMTPDEALEIAQALTNAGMFWLMNYKPYWDTFMKRKRELDRKNRKR
jgi:hypothetical protein